MPQVKPSEEANILLRTLLYIGILFLLPFGLDLFSKLALVLGAGKFVADNLWLQDVLGYLPLYIIALFYLRTTFNGLAYYGYTFNRQWFGWAVYIGIGSGIIMFFMDKINNFTGFTVVAHGVGGVLGYILAWALLPAFFEETLFRGVIQRFYLEHIKKTVSQYQISLSIFAAVAFEVAFHIYVPAYYGTTHSSVSAAFFTSIPQLIYVAIFGSVAGYFYQRTKSLTGPITIHLLGNLTELILILLFR